MHKIEAWYVIKHLELIELFIVINNKTQTFTSF